MERAAENKMGTAPLFRLIVTMAIPSIVSLIVQSTYNIVDSIFVSWISEDALTALSLVYPIQNVLAAISNGTAIGVNSLIARRLGEKNQKDANSAATHGVILAALTSVLFAIFGLFFSEAYLRMYTDVPSIIEMGTSYMRIVTVFSFGLFIETALEKILQATGDMIQPMIFHIIGMVLNIILDPILIFGWLGMPALGVAGAAIATVTAQILSMIYAIFILKLRSHKVQVVLKRFRFNWRIIKNIYAVGFPSMVMQSISSIMVSGMNAIFLKFFANGETAVAFFGIYFKLQSFVYLPVLGVGYGLMPIWGYNFGAKNKQRVISGVKIGNLMSIIIMFLGTVLFWVIPGPLLRIFNASPEMLALGIPALRILSLCFVPAAVGIMFADLFQALGKGFYSLASSCFRQLVLVLPIGYLLASTGFMPVWYALPFAELFSTLMYGWFYYVLYKNKIKPLDQQKAEQELAEQERQAVPNE